MSEVDTQLFGECMDAAIRHMSSFVFRSLKCPVLSDTADSIVARKPAVADDITVQRQHFKEQLMRRYDEVQLGQTKLLIAGTGVGKTTVLPAEIATQRQCSGIVLMPSGLLAHVTSSYVAEKIVPEAYKGLTVCLLRSQHLERTLTGNVVYYTSATEFLALLAKDRTLCQLLNLQFIYVDEAHEVTPEYFFLKILIASDVFNSTKVLYGSATANTMNMENEEGGMPRTVISVDPEKLPLDTPGQIPGDSPAYNGNIKSRMIIFATLDSISQLEEYYSLCDIPVYVYTTITPTSQYASVSAAFSSEKVAVLLTDHVLQTGVTIGSDGVIDGGFIQVLEVDLVRRQMDVVKRPVTLAERIQRCGRCGRNTPGVAYFANRHSTKIDWEVVPGSECYIALWAAAFSLKTNLPVVRQYMQIFGDMTPNKAMLLLHSKVHPLYLHSHMDSSGKFYNNWADVFARVLPMAKLQNTAAPFEMDEWVMQFIRNQDYLQSPVKIQTAYGLPHTWSPLPYAVWTSLRAGEWDFLGKVGDTRSVLSAVPEVKHVAFHKPTAYRRASVMTTLAPSTSKHRRIKSEIAPPLPSVPEKYVSPLERDEPSNGEGGKAEEGLKRRSVPTISVSSPSSPKFRVTGKREGYKHIDAEKIKSEKLFPADIDLFERYEQDPRCTEADRERLFRMMQVKVRLYNQTTDGLHVHFLSLIRCWNADVVESVQILAAVSRPAIFFRDPIEKEKDKLVDRMTRMRPLFRTFQISGLLVVHKKTARQTGSLELLREFEHDRMVASAALSMGRQAVKDRVSEVCNNVSLLCVDNVRRGVMLTMERYKIGVLHTVAEHSVLYQLDNYWTTVVRCAGDDTVVYKYPELQSDAVFHFRQPHAEESVYLVGIGVAATRPEVYGVYTVFGSGDNWYYYAQFVAGYSGSVLVAQSDGCIVGFHVGHVFKMGDKPVSEFVPADKYQVLLT